MITGKEIVNKIDQTLQTEELVNMRITEGLEALEKRDYLKAKKVVNLILKDAEFIESRMAALAIEQVAIMKDEDKTVEFLSTIYDL